MCSAQGAGVGSGRPTACAACLLRGRRRAEMGGGRGGWRQGDEGLGGVSQRDPCCALLLALLRAHLHAHFACGALAETARDLRVGVANPQPTYPSPGHQPRPSGRQGRRGQDGAWALPKTPQTTFVCAAQGGTVRWVHGSGGGQPRRRQDNKMAQQDGRVVGVRAARSCADHFSSLSLPFWLRRCAMRSSRSSLPSIVTRPCLVEPGTPGSHYLVVASPRPDRFGTPELRRAIVRSATCVGHGTAVRGDRRLPC